MKNIPLKAKQEALLSDRYPALRSVLAKDKLSFCTVQTHIVIIANL